MRVGIALGSNLGDRIARLRAAATAIEAFAEPPVLFSRVYETAPVDCPPGSPSFLNAAMEIGFSEDLLLLLERLQTIEHANDRPKERGKNAPRTVDLDIIYADDLVLDLPGLQVPHPRAMVRAFVLCPLSDIAPNRKLPSASQTIMEQSNSINKSTITVYDAFLR